MSQSLQKRFRGWSMHSAVCQVQKSVDRVNCFRSGRRILVSLIYGSRLRFRGDTLFWASSKDSLSFTLYYFITGKGVCSPYCCISHTSSTRPALDKKLPHEVGKTNISIFRVRLMSKPNQTTATFRFLHDSCVSTKYITYARFFSAPIQRGYHVRETDLVYKVTLKRCATYQILCERILGSSQKLAICIEQTLMT